MPRATTPVWPFCAAPLDAGDVTAALTALGLASALQAVSRA
jgi:hypothetical protein